MKLVTPPPPFAFAPAPEDRAFRFQSGASARSLAELADRLAEESDAVVGYHRAHFAPWIRDVVGDEPLARRFEQYARSQGMASDVLRGTLVALARARLAELRSA